MAAAKVTLEDDAQEIDFHSITRIRREKAGCQAYLPGRFWPKPDSPQWKAISELLGTDFQCEYNAVLMSMFDSIDYVYRLAGRAYDQAVMASYASPSEKASALVNTTSAVMVETQRNALKACDILIDYLGSRMGR